MPSTISRDPLGASASPRNAWALINGHSPQTENNDETKNKIDELTLRAATVSLQGGKARVRIDGHLKMRHSFYHKPDRSVVETDLVGFIDFDPAKQRILALRLITDKATYADSNFAVACRSLP